MLPTILIFNGSDFVKLPTLSFLVIFQYFRSHCVLCLQVLKEVYLSKSTNIILDCSKDIIGEVLTQAQQIGMISEDHFYLLTSLDTHTVDMSGFKVRIG